MAQKEPGYTPEERQLLWEKYEGDATAPGFGEDRARLAAGEPLAYVIGCQPFLGLKIFLDSKPLIPRPETEWWTERLLAALPRDRTLTFLDLCAGSGAIGCAALSRLPKAEVYFGEIDPIHAATIRKNIRENGLDANRAGICIGDLFKPFDDLTFDIITANPPYTTETRVLDTSVVNHEPHGALFAGEDGLALIRRIARELPHRLTQDGIAWIECDSAHAERARELFTLESMHARVIPDQYGTPRVIAVSFR